MVAAEAFEMPTPLDTSFNHLKKTIHQFQASFTMQFA